MRVLVLGGGISGLTAAYYLSAIPGVEVTVLEKSSRFGGAIETNTETGYHFERGPHTFRTGISAPFLQLIHDSGLSGETIGSASCTTNRYILHKGKLECLPKSGLGALTSPIFKGHRLPFLREWRVPPKEGEESLYEFISRRFDGEIASSAFAAMAEGIYAGDIEKLSSTACFPLFKEWEMGSGSLTRGFFRYILDKRFQKKPNPLQERLKGAALFSFQKGIEEIVRGTVDAIDGVKITNCPVEAISHFPDRVEVLAGGKTFQADYLFSALPCHVIGKLLAEHDREASETLAGIECRDLLSINIGYADKLLPIQGFGFLAPPRERATIAGVIFDSEVFPSHNRREKETRLTMMMRGLAPEKEAIGIALEALEKYLGIKKIPDAVSVVYYPQMIPQYFVGHLDRIGFVQKRLSERMPRLSLLGNYLKGVGVSDCIGEAKGAVMRWREALCATNSQDYLPK